MRGPYFEDLEEGKDETTILGKRESKGKPDRGIVSVETRATNQRGEIVLTLRRTILLYKRGAGPSVP